MGTLRGLPVTAVGARVALVIACVAASLAPSQARAQQDIPFDRQVAVQLFEYATGPHSFMTVPDADTTGDGQYTVDFLVTFLTDPFTVYEVDENDELGNPRTRVVESVLAGEINGSYGFGKRLQIGAALPLVFSMSGQGIDVATAMEAPGGLQVSGTGDLRLEAKYMLLRQDRLRLSVLPTLILPTSFGSEDSAFLGDNTPSGRVNGVVQWSTSDNRFVAGANLGVILGATRTLYASEVGQQFMYGAGLGYRVTDQVSVVGEAFGRSSLTFGDLDASPLEANGGVRVRLGNALSFLAGGGAGLVEGIGSPSFRVFASVGWAPDDRDDDADGVANVEDKCPLEAEDRDGFADSDGCPDPDNDGDKREDAIDKCPLEAEDLDGFQDDDGCPEADNDNDGFLDADDRCPVDPEDGQKPYDKDGCPANKRDSDDDGVFDSEDLCPDDYEDQDQFEDWDGCPEADNDNDNIPDDYDTCPVCPEDPDGWDDDDGCPDTDNDSDGVPDASDKCPDEAEVLNGVDDFDGCPDTGGVTLAELVGDKVEVRGTIDFSRRGLSRRGEVFVDQIALVMLQNPDVSRWRVAVVERDADTAQARADAIKARLVSRGVPAASIEARGAGASRAIQAFVVLERQAPPEEGEAPMCPAGLEIKPRPKPPTPVAPAPAAPAPAKPAAKPTVAPAKPVAAATAAPKVTAKPAPAKPAPATGPVPDAFSAFAGTDHKVTFRRDKASFRGSAKQELGRIAALMKTHTDVKVEIGCHTDNRRGAKTQAITQSQCDLAAQTLIKAGVAVERIRAVGHGHSKPIGDNKKSSGRAKNRRVELSFSR